MYRASPDEIASPHLWRHVFLGGHESFGSGQQLFHFLGESFLSLRRRSAADSGFRVLADAAAAAASESARPSQDLVGAVVDAVVEGFLLLVGMVGALVDGSHLSCRRWRNGLVTKGLQGSSHE